MNEQSVQEDDGPPPGWLGCLEPLAAVLWDRCGVAPLTRGIDALSEPVADPRVRTARRHNLCRAQWKSSRMGVQIAKVSTPGAVFGELSVLLRQPHTADVRALEKSEFHIADALALLANDATVTLYVAAILARRHDIANQALIEVKRQLQVGDPCRVIGNTVEKAEQLLMSGGVSLVYAGYPYDPFVPR